MKTIGCLPSQLGWMAVVMNHRRLMQLTFGHSSAGAAMAGLNSKLAADAIDADDPLLDRLARYAAGENDDFTDVELDFEGLTDFQQRVIGQCRRIPRGQTLSYADLSLQVGSNGAARAVGTVMARNRFPLVVPCHRVVGSGGKLGGFSAFNGLSTKRLLLAREGVDVLSRWPADTSEKVA